MSIKTFAAIDVGSFELTMKIYEFPAKNVLKEIDRITTQIDLGGDTYATGKISNEKMDELCRELERFSSIMKAYRVNGYRAYATSAIREAKNGLIVLDQITQRTGLEVKVLSNSEQRFLNYKAIASKGNVLQKIIEEETAILDIGGGSIQISLFDNDTLVSTQNLRLGVLRIQEILNHLNAGSSQMDELVDEIVTAQMSPYKKLYLKDREIKNIIIVGMKEFETPELLKVKEERTRAEYCWTCSSWSVKYVLEKYGEKILINTSFNGKNEPIVENPSQARKTAKEIGLDYLFIDASIEKVR